MAETWQAGLWHLGRPDIQFCTLALPPVSGGNNNNNKEEKDEEEKHYGGTFYVPVTTLSSLHYFMYC